MNGALRPSIGVDVDEELSSFWKAASVPTLTLALQARHLGRHSHAIGTGALADVCMARRRGKAGRFGSGMAPLTLARTAGFQTPRAFEFRSGGRPVHGRWLRTQ